MVSKAIINMVLNRTRAALAVRKRSTGWATRSCMEVGARKNKAYQFMVNNLQNKTVYYDKTVLSVYT
jgi:hypothetical protein